MIYTLFIYLSVICFVVSSEILNVRSKRTDIDLPTCIDNFDIHKDKIIRTQDSQKMGAKYLNAIDLGSREECLRLCCETDNCDVFVYEDKNSGSCYLFQCGPPEDFKCKFTHHFNYSSAVLAINRHLPDLESQIKLTKHEQDLTKLRKNDIDLESAPHIPEERIPPPPVSSTTPRTIEVLPEQKTVSEEKKCSRFQFECRSTRECIAIYNACDGIPQCADGSDEAPELGCPVPSTLPPLTPLSTHRISVDNPPLVPLAVSKNISPVRNRDSSASSVGYLAPPRSVAVPVPPGSGPEFPRNPDQNTPQRIPQYPEPPEYYPQIPPLVGWNAHQSGQGSYQMPPLYPGKTSHIFNHKENGLQVPEAEISPYSDNINYPKLQNYYGDNYRQPMETPNWVNAHQDDLRYPSRYNQEPSYITRIAEPKQEKYNPQTKTSSWSEEKENPEHIQMKMAHELKNSKSIQAQNAKEDVHIKIIEKHKEHDSIDYPDVVAYKMDGNDGVAQTPGGAVLSLTLGLLITCIMAVMIACRLRIVRRRTRKGGKGYAHDADYLVNGMYL